ncbi:MAG: hypothetical protein ABW328_11450 [Ilumatobacteraceae bacterium]
MTPLDQRRRIGIEHEFKLFVGGRSVDARTILGGLDGLGRRLDPDDAHAVRGAWGGVITCDERELEVVTPPAVLGPGAIRRVVGFSIAGREALTAALPAGHVLSGYSTHLNVEVDDRRVCRVAKIIAERCAPALMLALDRPDSPGLIVRPRNRRLELGGEYASGAQLRAALTMAAGVAALAEHSLSDRRLRSRLPPSLQVQLQPSPQRFGWYVDRRAYGPDLYAAGRRTVLRCRNGSTTSAHDVLRATWTAARPEVEEWSDEDDLRLVDEMVDGSHALPVDRRDDDGGVHSCHGVSLIEPWRRGSTTVTVTAATWRTVVMRVDGPARSHWLTVAGDRVEEFVEALERGALDGWLTAGPARRGSERQGRRKVLTSG